MKHVTIAAAALAASLAGAALAQPFPDPYGDATVARADEEAKAGERFAAADTNHDGAISEDELEAAAQGQRGPGGGGLRRADANEDGKITKDEFVAAQLRRFDMQDANKDGQLTKAERDAFRAERMRNGPGGGNGGGGWGGPPPGQ
ncbi:EF-hand domain-containing protein [Novosphingobium sp. JCM 18896]|uniref:EF-hand domain-containing protein n=1 Tax=Novosphingobium sp. JCM 18896 TaxID=2989731 RepID=UPI0022216C5D|nr:EF-hand domain-containing protein [Novosphingobium sp. JCM 18896]MCW1429100.1 EF-hand domain-containing protein [Novosphingobium sp. JCM 18896]